MIGRKTLLTLMLIFVILLSGCSQKNNETDDIKEDMNSFKELMLSVVDIDENIAEGAADKIYEWADLKLGKMVSAELVENDGEVYVISMTNVDGEEYYITTDTDGYLGTVRKGSRTGITLFGIVD